jgi:hypothetical protein
MINQLIPLINILKKSMDGLDLLVLYITKRFGFIITKKKDLDLLGLISQNLHPLSNN